MRDHGGASVPIVDNPTNKFTRCIGIYLFMIKILTFLSVWIKVLLMTEEVFISTDIESDGPVPPLNSMLSFGSAAFTLDKMLIGTFSANLKTLPGAVQDEDTMKFWSREPDAWEICRENQQDPEHAMKNYSAWLKSLNRKTIFVGYPLPFDSHFIRYYLTKYTGECPFGFSGLDIKSYAMAHLKRDSFSKTTKRKMKRFKDDGLLHSHVSIEDAIEQGALFINILRENLGLPKIDSIIYKQLNSF